MELLTAELRFPTKGFTHIIDITPKLEEQISRSGFLEGNILAFCVGSTAGITTVEFEPGLVNKDLPGLFDRLAPYGDNYAHHNTWGDDNGASHVRASLLGSSLTIPFIDGRMTLGTWQQIIYIDFDTRPRDRRIVLQITGLPAH